MMGNMTVKLPRIRPYFNSATVFCATTNTTLILQILFGVHLIGQTLIFRKHSLIMG